MNLIRNNKFVQLWLILGIIAGFASILFFTVTYLNQKVLCDIDCEIKNEVNLVLVLLSLFGMFIGSLTYYFISEKYEKKIVKIHHDVNLTLKFLEGDERAIIKSLISHNGELTQSEIGKETGLSRVKIFRCLKNLEQRKLITKMPKGMTNTIMLDTEIRSVFCKD
jgi:uncharacterized protein YneF (UPF0154 family)